MGKTLMERIKGKHLGDYFRFSHEYIHNLRETKKLSKTVITESGLNKEKRDVKIIITLTSFPARINNVSKCIKTLLNQTLKPDKVLLWLAEEQFPDKDKQLPKDLLELMNFGLTIRWCKDIRSYKKLVPAIKEYPNEILVTADDDIYYDRNWLELLYKGYEKDDHCIWCHRVTKLIIDVNQEMKLIAGGREIYPYPSYCNKLVGCGGVLYPPGTLHSDVLKDNVFMKLAPTNDDVWFWFMGVMNGTKTSVVPNRIMWNKEVAGTRLSALSNINNDSEIIRQMKLLLDKYPVIKERILHELQSNE